MKKIIVFVGLICISTLLLARDYTFTVNHPNPTNPDYNFTRIQDAITFGVSFPDLIVEDPEGVDENGNTTTLDFDDHVIIEVYPNFNALNGQYEENFIIDFVGSLPNLTIKSYQGGRISLTPLYLNTAICKIIRYGHSLYDPVTIEGFDFYNDNQSDIVEINEDHSGNYGIYTSSRNVFVNNCNFIPNERQESFVHDIYLYQMGDKSSRYLTVNNCNFEQDLYWYRFLEYARIVGYLDQPDNASSSYIFNAINNNFVNNKKSIDMRNSFNLTIKSNNYVTLSIGELYDRMVSFYLENHPVIGDGINVEGNYLDNANNAFYIKPKERNLFDNNYVLNTIESEIICSEACSFNNNVITFDAVISYTNAGFGIAPPVLKNNTFYRDPQSSGSLELSFYIDYLINNIIYGFNSNSISESGPFNKIANLFDPSLNYPEVDLNLTGSPNFTNIANGDFSLVWPCKAIGNGYSPEFNSSDPGYDMKLLTYQDDTIDIGAIPFDQDRKQYHRFEGGTTTKNWTAFPALDPENETTIFYNGMNQNLPNNNMIVMFQDLHDQWGNYASVGYKDWDDYNDYVPHTFNWMNQVDPEKLIEPYLGYKITAQNGIDHWFGGLMQNADMDIPLPATPNEIWLGYHVPFTSDALVAFDDILGSLQTIKHKDWALYWNGTKWTGRTSTGNTNLEMGDFVEIKFRSNVTPPTSFNWTYYHSSNPSSFKYQDATYVSYEDKSDYSPFFVDIDENSNIEEIALYANNECIGGAKTQGETTVMVKAFMEDIPNDCEISVVTFTGAKSSKKANQISEYNPNLQVWDMASIIIKDNRSAYHVSLRKDHNSILETNNIVTINYPNPFNPETTIEFNNPVQGQVDINIYNLKGQLVKNLLQDNLNQGVHKVIWHGRDSNDKQVASGVYFYKISSGNKQSVTKKIILMK